MPNTTFFILEYLFQAVGNSIHLYTLYGIFDIVKVALLVECYNLIIEVYKRRLFEVGDQSVRADTRQGGAHTSGVVTHE